VGAGGNPAIAGSDGAAPASVAAPGILDPPGLESPHEIPVDGYNVAAPGEWLGLGRSSPHDAPAPGGPDDAGEHPQTPSEADAVSVAPAPGISRLDEDPPPW
jgi:hypothetical protein